MEIRIDSLIDGASRAEGTVVIIDVYRAFTTAAVAFSRGATKILLVADVDEALELRARGIGDLCMGEIDGARPDEFDFGNSPQELLSANVCGKTLVQSTRAGTVGVAAVKNADTIFACSLALAKATVDVILAMDPKLVSLVAMGANGHSRTDEDEQCALYLRNLLEGRQPDRDAVRNLILVGRESLKFESEHFPHHVYEDREISLQIDRFPFAIQVEKENDILVARAVR